MTCSIWSTKLRAYPPPGRFACVRARISMVSSASQSPVRTSIRAAFDHLGGSGEPVAVEPEQLAMRIGSLTLTPPRVPGLRAPAAQRRFPPVWPAVTWTVADRPVGRALMWCSIFTPRITRVVPALTRSPTATRTAITVPGMGAARLPMCSSVRDLEARDDVELDRPRPHWRKMRSPAWVNRRPAAPAGDLTSISSRVGVTRPCRRTDSKAPSRRAPPDAGHPSGRAHLPQCGRGTVEFDVVPRFEVPGTEEHMGSLAAPCRHRDGGPRRRWATGSAPVRPW